LREEIASLDSGVPSSKLAPETVEAVDQSLPSADKTKGILPVDMKTVLPSVKRVQSSGILNLLLLVVNLLLLLLSAKRLRKSRKKKKMNLSSAPSRHRSSRGR
jgi:hypothetical protein